MERIAEGRKRYKILVRKLEADIQLEKHTVNGVEKKILSGCKDKGKVGNGMDLTCPRAGTSNVLL